MINVGLPVGNTGATPNLTLLTGDTLPAGSDAAVREAPGSTPEAPSFYLDLPAGVTPVITVESVVTLAPGSNATVTLAGSITPEAPRLVFGIPQGTPGAGIQVFIIEDADWPPPDDANPLHWYVHAT